MIRKRKTFFTSAVLVIVLLCSACMNSAMTVQIEPPQLSPSAEASAQPSVTEPSVNERRFEGLWRRTNTHKAEGAQIEITSQTESGFDFHFSGVWGAHNGDISGTADFTGTSSAVFEHTDSDFFAKVEFALRGDVLAVCLADGDTGALGFGHNVTMDGEYTIGEPVYINAGRFDELFPTGAEKDKLLSIMGYPAYQRLLDVFEYGFEYESDNLTYSGFISGAGTGADLKLDGEYVYCLGFYLGSGGYTLYTNDARYKDSLPGFFEIGRDGFDLSFVYADTSGPTEFLGKYGGAPELPYGGETPDDFLPEGWSIFASLELDFNSDGIKDIVAAAQRPDTPYAYFPRMLFGLEGIADGYQLSFCESGLLPRPEAGGVMGDPLSPEPQNAFETNGTTFSFWENCGSRESWYNKYRYAYLDGEWKLIYSCEETYDKITPENSVTENDYATGEGRRSFVTAEGEMLEFTVRLDEPPPMRRDNLPDLPWLSELQEMPDAIDNATIYDGRVYYSERSSSSIVSADINGENRIIVYRIDAKYDYYNFEITGGEIILRLETQGTVTYARLSLDGSGYAVIGTLRTGTEE